MLRRYLVPALLLLSFTVLQITLIPQLGVLLRQIDLSLGLTIAYALLLGPAEGALFGICAGLLRGIMIGPALGLYAVPLYIIGYCVGQFSRVVYRDSIFVPVIVGLVTTGAYWILMTLITGGLYGFWLNGQSWLSFPTTILVNGVVTTLIHALLSGYAGQEVAGGRG